MERILQQKGLETRDLSLINGLGASKKGFLADCGVKNLDGLLDFGASRLEGIPGIRGRTAQNYMLHAESLIDGRIIRKPGLPDLPARTTEIFLDLEGLDALAMGRTHNIQTDYLIGVLVRSGTREEYVPFVARDHDGEEDMLNEFVDFVRNLDDYVIYHWHSYEMIHLANMMDMYGLPQNDRHLVLPSDVMVDLHPVVTKHFVFPFPGTSIKAVAKHLGFSWRHRDVGAMTSVDLYLDYVNNSNRDSLNLVLDYNRDDCEATRIIKDWLVQQKAKDGP